MKKIVMMLLWVSLSSLAADNPPLVVNIHAGADQLHELADMNVDVLDYDAGTGQIQAIVTAGQRQELQARGFRIDNLVDDLNEHLRQLHNSDYFQHFHSVQQIQEYMYQLAEQYPDLVRVEDIGDSYNKTQDRGGFDILALKLSDDVTVEDSTEADVLYAASIHAREIITSEVLIVFLDHLLNGYGTDPLATYLINNREMWFVLCINPDGRDYVFTGDYDNMGDQNDPLYWRKNMRDNNGNGVFDPEIDGVDLNRNFGYQWGYDDLGSSPVESSGLFRGPAPFSEPETQAIRDLVARQDFVVSLMYHSYANKWLYPWCYRALQPNEPDLSTFKALADSCVAYNGYEPGNNATGTIYLVNGYTDDWMYAEYGIFAFTPEVGSLNTGMFWPYPQYIDLLTRENLGPNLYMAYAAGEVPIIRDYTYKTFTNPAQTYSFRISITGAIPLKNPAPLDSSSLYVYYRYGREGAFDSTALELLPPIQQFIAKLPGNDYRGTIQYYITASDTLGRRGTWPRGAPMALDSLTIAEADTVLDEIATAEVKAPDGFALSNYPNPFNGSTVIQFNLPEYAKVRLTIYNRLGQQIKVLADREMAPGGHRLVWDAHDGNGIPVASGIYFCRLELNNQHLTRKLLYVR